MKCPKCNEEALFVNGKYVCVDCGIEITPEEQASQFSSNDLLDANPNVAGSNPITDPDPQVSRAFNKPVTDNQNQPLSTPDPVASTAVPPVDEPTNPEPAPEPVSEQTGVINEPVISEPIQAAVPEPTSPEAEPVLAEPSVPESVEVPTPDPVEPVMVSPINPVLGAPVPPVTDQVEPAPSFNEAEVKKPVEDYYKSELENTDKPQDNETPGSGIYDFTTNQNTENNQVSSAPETPQAPEAQAMASDLNEVPLPQAEIPVQSPVSSQDPLQSAGDVPVEPVPTAVDSDINVEENEIPEPVSETQPLVSPEVETVATPVVPEMPMEPAEKNVQSEPQLSELTGLESQPQATISNTPSDLDQPINEPLAPPTSTTLPTDGFTIPVQTEENSVPAPEPIETIAEVNTPEPLADDLTQAEPRVDNSSQEQPYFQPSTFEMSANNEEEDLNKEIPATDIGMDPSGPNNDEPNANQGADQGTNLNESFTPEPVEIPTADLTPAAPISDVEVSVESSVPSPETTNNTNPNGAINDPQENPKDLNDLLNQSSHASQDNSEPQLTADASISPEGQDQNSSNAGFSVDDIKNEGPMPTVESVFGNGGDGDKPTPQDYGLPAPKPPNEKKKKMILIGSLVGGLLLILFIVLMIFLSRPKNPYPIVLGAEAITTLSGNVTNVMDEKQDIAVKYEVSANYENLETKNLDSAETDSPSSSYSAAGDWLADKAGNIHVLSSVNGVNNKQTYMAGRSSTFIYDETTSKWSKSDGNKIASLPSYISPNSRSSAVYAQNIQSISVAGVEQISGANTRVYEIKPSKSYIESVNFLGSEFSSLSYVSLDSSNLSVKIWIGVNDNKVYKLELSGNLIIESEDFSGQIRLTTTASYEYRSVLISNPEETAKESPPRLMAAYFFKEEDGKPSSVNEGPVA